MKRLLICIFIIAAVSASAVEKVTLRIHWIVQAQFAGYFMATEKGFYNDAGLEVTIVPGSGDINGLAEVASGKIEFATQWLSSAMQFSSNGMPIKCVAQIFPRSMLVLVTRKNSGIKTIKDINGRKVGLWGGIFAAPIKALLLKNRVNRPIFIKEGFDMQPFVDGNYDAIGEVVSAMLYNEYNQIISKGVKEEDLLVFNPADYRANFPEDGIYCSPRLLSDNPDMIKKFVKATLKGWNYAVKNHGETVTVLMNNGAQDKNHQLNMIKVITNNILRDNKKVEATLSKKEFTFVQKALADNNLLGKKSISYNDFYIDILK